ncbi:MAG: hypothetical protein FJ298_14235 [Planctomycetes bacterium]|nr:hypothetical protein [Planctomycetota bacterium]
MTRGEEREIRQALRTARATLTTLGSYQWLGSEADAELRAARELVALLRARLVRGLAEEIAR